MAAQVDLKRVNFRAQRALDDELVEVDLRLQYWALWAKPKYQELGFPTRSSTELANEGGLLAKEGGQLVAPIWPVEVVACEHHVAKLTVRHLAAVLGTYFNLHLHSEQRAACYVAFTRYLVRVRENKRISRRDAMTTLGGEAYKNDLREARYSLKYLLNL